MANLAQQIKEELTERAKNSESCKKYLLDWVLDQFRKGNDPVIIYCTELCDCPSKELIERVKSKDKSFNRRFYHLIYKDGRHYFKGTHIEIDITDLPDAQRYACNGQDISDKRLFLESEGFHVYKYWKYGTGDIMEIRY